MKLTMSEQLSRFGRRAWWGGALTGLLLAAGATAIGDVTPEGRRVRDARRQSFSLFAGPTAVLRGNQLQCGLDNSGNVCTDVFSSPTGGGGFWPTGTSNGYLFNTGLQVAGIVSAGGGPRAGDTVGAYFFDATGNQPHGTPLTEIFDSQISGDVDTWPADAFIQDESLFPPVLLGRKTASQQDSWVRYWDGDPAQNASRKHPVGISVTQRSLAWNFPAGNESIIYFIYDFENSTADPDFQLLNEQRFFGSANALPDEGWTLEETYSAFGTDMDIGTGSDPITKNFSTAILPFDIGLSYLGTFQEPAFTYPPALFFPPFFTDAPGLVGIKYLKSPVNPATGQEVGLTLFSTHQNQGPFFDPTGDEQLFRYLSGKLDPALGDAPCNVTPEINTPDPATTERSICFVLQSIEDTRFFQASGPFDLPAGDAAQVVVAYIVAATVATMPDGTPSGIVPSANGNDNAPGVASFHPGFQSDRGCDINGLNCTVSIPAGSNPVKPIERGAGWFQYTGPPPAGFIEQGANKLDQFQVDVVPGSLLGKALVAQTIFDNQFLLGFAPDAPNFFLIPGDGQVTVIWETSASEANGDPFFDVASDPGSALFNPNYRQFDVEIYRIFRGTTAANLSPIAQFDFAATTFTDFTCETVGPEEDVGSMADVGGIPTAVVGFVAGETCGLAGGSGLERSVSSAEVVFNNGNDGGGPGGGNVRTASLLSIPVAADTIGISGSSLLDPFVPLVDTGVPFVFVDTDVVNNFTYFYAVAASDVNSQAAGPPVLSSARIVDATVPRGSAPNLVSNLVLSQAIVTGDDDVPLDTSGGVVQPDSETGIFPGPQNPTNGVILGFAPDPSLVGTLVNTGGVSGQIDSVVPASLAGGVNCPNGDSGLGTCFTMYLTVLGQPTVIESFTPVWSAFGGPSSGQTDILLGADNLDFNPAELAKHGIPAGAGAGVQATATGEYGSSIFYSSFEGQLSRRISSADGDNQPGGSRWFDGANNTTPDPARQIRVGHLEGIDSVWAPIHHTPIDGSGGAQYPASGSMQCFGYSLAFLGRAADVKFTWGAGGGFDSVRDIVHNVDVSFRESPSATYGFMNTDANGNGFLDWQDFDYLDAVLQNTSDQVVSPDPIGGFCGLAGLSGLTQAFLETTAVIGPTSTQGDVAGAMVATGTGFGLYVNGERYIFETSALPAAGTEWTLRTYIGTMGVNPDPSAFTDDPTGYAINTTAGFGGVSGTAVTGSNRPPMIPGLRFSLEVLQAGSTSLEGTPDLSLVHSVPDPYLGTSLFDLGPTSKQLMFVNMPVQASIRIYSLTGKLVAQIDHNDPSQGGRAQWDLRNRNNQFVASGVYFFHVSTPAGDEHVGKMTIINSAGAN